MKKKLSYTLAAALLLVSAGCISCSTMNSGSCSSTTPLTGKSISENRGTSEGSTTTYSILGLWDVNAPDMSEAVKAAVTAKEGDALVNARWYGKYYYFFFFSMTRYTIEGEVVKLGAESKDSKRRPEVKK